jgi:signal transduction histidine kinase
MNSPSASQSINESGQPRSDNSLSQRWHKQIGGGNAFVLAAMLAALYPIFFEPDTALWQRMLFVFHIGLFLIWQPMIERHREVSWGAALVTVGAVTLASVFLTSWLLLLWLVLLSGVVGGKVLLAGSVHLRMGYLAALAYLTSAILFLALPAAVPAASVDPLVRLTALWVLPLLVVSIMVLRPKQSDAAGVEVLDLVNTVLVMLMLSVLVLGTLSSMLLFKLGYMAALLQALFVLAGVMIVVGWAWNPHFGYAGLQSVFSRYLLSIGVPAQQWLEALADLTQRESHPEQFFAAACADMTQRVSWIRGMYWQLDTGTPEAPALSGVTGSATGVRTQLTQPGVRVDIYTSYALPPSVEWHMNLIVRLIAEFYADKQRAGRLREISYMRAIHETGARLTHDVKNLLQSLQTLIYAAEYAQEHDADQFRDLMRRQLPTINARLSVTLEKLRAPQQEVERSRILADFWWQGLRQRHAQDSWLDFALPEGAVSALIPQQMFSTVTDNILSNLFEKRSREPALKVQLSLVSEGVGTGAGAEAGALLCITDDGAPIPPDQVDDLLRRPVQSVNGLGIGLYQSGQLAQSMGYELSIARNRPGEVRFVLKPQSVVLR